MKRVGYIAGLVFLAALTQGCFVSDQLVTIGDGKVAGIQVPESVLAQGRSAARDYVLTKYPFAAPIIDQILPSAAPVGPPQFIQVPITYVTNLTVQLKDGVSVNGSQFITGAQMESVFVQVKATLGEPVLPADKTATYSPGQFAANVIGAPAPATAPEPEDTVGPDTPVPADNNDLETNPALPPE